MLSFQNAVNIKISYDDFKLFFPYEIFKIQCVFYTRGSSQFGPATFQVTNSCLWLGQDSTDWREKFRLLNMTQPLEAGPDLVPSPMSYTAPPSVSAALSICNWSNTSFPRLPPTLFPSRSFADRTFCPFTVSSSWLPNSGFHNNLKSHSLGKISLTSLRSYQLPSMCKHCVFLTKHLPHRSKFILQVSLLY